MTQKDTPAKPRTPVAVATVIQVQAPTSAKPGDKALISADGTIDGWVGGGCVQPAVISVINTVVTSGQPCLLRVAPSGQWEPVDGLTDYSSGCLGRGSLLIFVEALHIHPTLCIMGESAVALSLAEQAVRMNLNVIVQSPHIDPQAMSSSIVVQSDFTSTHSDYIVIATQGKGDRNAIAAALEGACTYIKMVVSERKLAALKEQLRSDGFTDESLARLEGPAGIHIRAQQPNEVALSVLAEIVQSRRNTDKQVTPAIDANKAVTQAKQSGQVNKAAGGCCSE